MFYFKFVLEMKIKMFFRCSLFQVIAEDQTPRFLDVPIDSEVHAGDPVRFQCRVEGEPFPTVSFYRVSACKIRLLTLRSIFSFVRSFQGR